MKYAGGGIYSGMITLSINTVKSMNRDYCIPSEVTFSKAA
jgi:hypothetical protein